MVTLAVIRNSTMNETGKTIHEQVAGSRILSPALYLLAIAGFFFTFFNLRCGEAQFAKLSGVAMATAGKCDIKPDFLQPSNEKDKKEDTPVDRLMNDMLFKKSATNTRLPINYWALAALVSGIIALFLSFFQSAKGYLIRLAVGGTAILALLIMLFTRQQYALKIMKLDTVLRNSPGALFGDQMFITLKIAWAYWLSLFSFTTAFFAVMVRQKKLMAERENEEVLLLFNPGNEETEEKPV
jgi:hypothetical protein